MTADLGNKSLSALLWVLVDKMAGSLTNFIIAIILARLLTPEDFGLVAMVMIFIEFSSIFIESGFSTALVREKEISEADKSTTFIFNFVASLVLYVVLFFSAPAIASFFDQPALLWIVRIMGINLIIQAVAIIQRSALTQQIDFKTQTKVRLLGVLVSGAIAIVLALRGFGAWALVAKLLVMGTVETFFLWFANPWKPSWTFSKASFRRLFGFGSNILACAVLDKFYVNIYNLLIGKFFSAATLGFYTQALYFSTLVYNNLFQAVNRVTYPVLAKLQDNLESLKDGYRKVLKLSSFFMIPAMIILGILAEPVIVTVVGEKWLPAVPFLQLLCVAGLTRHFSSINLNMLLVLGRSDLSLKLEVIKKINITIAIVIGIQYGIYGLLIADVVTSYINLLINVYYSDKLLKYSFREQLLDVVPTILISIVVGGLVLAVRDYSFAYGLGYLLFMLGLAGTAYLLLHYLLRTEEMTILTDKIIPKTIQLITKTR